MIKNQKETTVSVGLIKILNAYATGLGVRFTRIAESCNFDLTLLNTNEARVSTTIFESMWLQIVSESQDPHPGLNFGRQMAKQYPGGSILFTMMLNCDTIEKALKVFVRYHRIMSDMVQPDYQKKGVLTHLSWNILQPGLHTGSHLSEALLCTYHSILNTLSRGKLIFNKVCFIHDKPKDSWGVDEYQRIFKVPVYFSMNNNELMIETQSLDLKIDLANHELYSVLEKYATRIMRDMPRDKKWSFKVSQIIRDMLFRGDKPDISSLSQKLALSKRSLQEKLKKEQNSFRSLLEIIRKQMAMDYLARQETVICDLAFMLGYSDQSAFNHAFKRWTGRTPKAYIRESF